jgi:dihydroxyacetone kinase-like predicted kinase
MTALLFAIIYIITEASLSSSCVFYDSMLFDITTEDRLHKVSANGYAWGYIGSCIPFVVCLLLVLVVPNEIMSMQWRMTLSFIITAIWWLGFTLPLFKRYQQKNFMPKPERPILGTFKRLSEIFKDLFVDRIIEGGQTMNPSSEDFVSAIKKANAHNVFIFPNNSNIVMAASQACDMVEDADTNVYVIPSKTIPQGISSAIMFNPEADPEENFRCMKAALKNVKSGEVTFSIRDTEFNGLKVKKDDFIGIYEKDIVVDNPDKIETLMILLDKMIDDESSIITILVGADVDEETMNNVANQISEKYSDLDLDIRKGDQPVYSFLIGVE